MFELKDIQELIKAVDHSSLDEFVYEYEGAKIKLRKNNYKTNKNQGVTEVSTEVFKPLNTSNKTESITEEIEKPAVEPTTFDYEITAPMVGTFYYSSTPDSDPFVAIGDSVNTTTVVCIVEAMKLFNEIEADVSGEVVDILVENGELVEYGQPLFRIKTK